MTIQNYFRLYKKLSGMTGTAATEAAEFHDIYKMDVVEIPTNRPIARIDEDDEVYRTMAEKNRAICGLIAERHVIGQPILVGTVSIEKSDSLSKMLLEWPWEVEIWRLKPEFAEQLKAEAAGRPFKTVWPRREIDADPLAMRIRKKFGDAAFEVETKSGKGVPHNVLNAKHHEQEAYIVADAGLPGAVTIATNMAGRGTDIQLGGNLDMRMMRWRADQRAAGVEPDQAAEFAERDRIAAEIEVRRQEALALGGLFVLGTERHESRRIDNQLRGRTGRQGDPGFSKFYLSCEDDLLRIFAGDRLDAIMRNFGVQEGEAITHKWLNGAIATAQKRVEQRNYEIRKNLLKYDDVVNEQRKAIFEQRQEFLESEDLSELVDEFRRDTVTDLVDRFLPPKAYAEQWDIEGLDERVKALLGLELPVREWAAEEGVSNEEMEERLQAASEARAAERLAAIGPEQMRGLEKNFMLQMIDMQWREHLVHLEHLRAVIGLRGYAQRDPLNEYKTEAFSLFEALLVNLRQNVTRWLMTVEFRFAPPPPPVDIEEVHLNPLTGENEMADPARQMPEGQSDAEQRSRWPVEMLPEGWERTSRNAMCPCGSGRKFKHCHGALI